MVDNQQILIVTGGSSVEEALLRRQIAQSCFIIAADGGIKNFIKFEDLTPNLIVGDFDSAPKTGWQERFSHVEKVTFPKEKDYTDTELAIDEALKRQSEQICILGGIGSRLDHTLANMMLLSKIEKAGRRGLIIDNHNEIRQIDPGVTIVRSDEWMFMSLVPVSERICVTLKGFKYPLNRAMIAQESTVTISNEWSQSHGEVYLHEGKAFLIRSRD